jgi:hypothetical protein
MFGCLDEKRRSKKFVKPAGKVAQVTLCGLEVGEKA